MIRLATRVQQIKPSPTLAISAKAKAMQAAGVDVINFGAGEPDFDTPDNIKAAGIEAIQQGFTRYTAVPGIPELRKAIQQKLERENGLKYETDEIIVSCGGKHSFYNMAQALLDPGDEVIVPSPYWVSYPSMIQLAGGKAVIIPTTEDQGFKMSPDQLRGHISKKTRAVVINSPSNPTGSAYSLAELQELAAIITENNILVISDEIYEHIIYDGFAQHSIAGVNPQMKERTILLNGVSKSYAMTGWRIGFTAAPQPLVAAMTKIQSQSTSNPTSISQKAAIEAYNGPQDFIAMVLPAFDERRRYIVKALNDIPGISCFNPSGAFYAFPQVKNLLAKSFNGQPIDSSLNLCALLLDEAKIAAVPGEAFGSPGYLRFSYATSLENIKNGMDRLENFIQQLT